jgi:hypothetical protein
MRHEVIQRARLSDGFDLIVLRLRRAGLSAFPALAAGVDAAGSPAGLRTTALTADLTVTPQLRWSDEFAGQSDGPACLRAAWIGALV